MQFMVRVEEKTAQKYWEYNSLFNETRERFSCKCRIIKDESTNKFDNQWVVDYDGSSSTKLFNNFIKNQSENDGITLELSFLKDIEELNRLIKNAPFLKSSRSPDNSEKNKFAWGFIGNNEGNLYLAIFINLESTIALSFQDFVKNYFNQLVSGNQYIDKHSLCFLFSSIFLFSENAENRISSELFMKGGVVSWFDSVSAFVRFFEQDLIKS